LNCNNPKKKIKGEKIKIIKLKMKIKLEPQNPSIERVTEIEENYSPSSFPPFDGRHTYLIYLHLSSMITYLGIASIQISSIAF
jgi:hypothetical protein